MDAVGHTIFTLPSNAVPGFISGGVVTEEDGNLFLTLRAEQLLRDRGALVAEHSGLADILANMRQEAA